MTAPTWDNIDHEVACPLCDYNLRGLSEPRCPECGHRFNWADVLRLKRFPKIFLYEYSAPCNVLRLLQTFLLSLLPRRFWKQVTAFMPVAVGKLILYWWIGTVTFGLLVMAAVWGQAYETASSIPVFSFSFVPLWPFSFEFDRVWGGNGEQVLVLLSLLLLWPWITTACFWLFAVTLRRSNIRPSHWFRCAVYSGDIIWIAGVFVVVATFRRIDLPEPAILRWISRKILLEGDALVALAGLLCLEVILTYRLIVAGRMYLAIPQASLIAVCSQVIVVLLMLIVAANLH